MDDGISDVDWSNSDYTEYAWLSSASHALQPVNTCTVQSSVFDIIIITL